MDYDTYARADAATLRRRVAVQGGNPHERFLLGLKLAEKKQFAEARAELTRVVAEQPDHYEAQYNLGCVCIDLGLKEEAVPHLSEGTKGGSQQAHSRCRCAEVLHELGRDEEALGFLVDEEAQRLPLFHRVLTDVAAAGRVSRPQFANAPSPESDAKRVFELPIGGPKYARIRTFKPIASAAEGKKAVVVVTHVHYNHAFGSVYEMQCFAMILNELGLRAEEVLMFQHFEDLGSFGLSPVVVREFLIRSSDNQRFPVIGDMRRGTTWQDLQRVSGFRVDWNDWQS